MATAIVLLFGCFADQGLWSVLFNLDTGNFNVTNSYNYPQISYFARTSPNFVYALSRDTSGERLLKFQLGSYPGNLTVSNIRNLQESGSAYLHARNISNSSERLSIAYYGGSGIQILDDINTSFKNGTLLKFNYSSYGDLGGRQNNSHPHCIIPMDHTTVTDYFVTDLGADRVYMVTYNSNDTSSNITLKSPGLGYIQIPTGYGPRHIVRHYNYSLIFVLNELNSSLLVFNETVYGQNYTLLNQYTTLVNATNENIDTTPSQSFQNAAHLAVTRDGKYMVCKNTMYIVTSNRGRRNSIVVFQLDDPIQGNLSVKSANGSGGFHPRYFEIYGNWLIVANMISNNIVSFRFNDGVIGDAVANLTTIAAPNSIIIAGEAFIIDDSGSTTVSGTPTNTTTVPGSTSGLNISFLLLVLGTLLSFGLFV